MMRSSGRLAIHRRSDEIEFLQHRLSGLSPGESLHQDVSINMHNLELAATLRERDLADELLHTRQIEPLGETLQRRLAMAEHICRELVQRFDTPSEGLYDRNRAVDTGPGSKDSADVKGSQSAHAAESIQAELPDAYWVAEIERRALNEMLNQWLAWLRRS